MSIAAEIQRSKRAKIKDFNQNGPAHIPNLYGLPFTPEESDTVVIAVPWEATVSRGEGAKYGPEAILAASSQVDLANIYYPRAWERGISMVRPPLRDEHNAFRAAAKICMGHLKKGGSEKDPSLQGYFSLVDKGGAYVADLVAREAARWILRGKLVGVVGGDHSSPLGLMQVLGGRYDEFGVLHIDAHFDLRDAYGGFKYSHASIMRNASEILQISKFVHVGIRSYCEEEVEFVAASQKRNVAFYSESIARKASRPGGDSWHEICQKIITALPERVYISADIDGFNPSLCPNTGTPVPGGLEFEQVMVLFSLLAESGREIIGFDICEVAPASNNPDTWETDWNAAVGAELLLKTIYTARHF